MAADVDIENCCFTLVAQLLDKLQPVLQVPTEIAATLKRCVQEREQICENDLRLGKEARKHILNMVLNGSGLPVGFTDNAFLKQLQTASRYLRWLACSLLPSVYESCKLNPQKTFPEASTFTYMWTAVEDTILASWVQFLLQHPVKHLSLHYDGVRVQGDFGCDVEALCTRCSEHIAASTGFVVVIREKKHYTFEEMLRAKAVERESVSNMPDIYKGPGSCIPSALWCLAGDTQQIRDRLSDMSHPDNVVAQRRRCRNYRTVCSLTGRQLTPDLGLCLEEPGDYLLHAEGNGDPHCIAARVPESRTPIQVFTRNMVYSVDANTFKALLQQLTRGQRLPFAWADIWIPTTPICAFGPACSTWWLARTAGLTSSLTPSHAWTQSQSQMARRFQHQPMQMRRQWFTWATQF
jgi:hypothetical protein